jgi:mitochondrial fission protein ELM1
MHKASFILPHFVEKRLKEAREQGIADRQTKDELAAKRKSTEPLSDAEKVAKVDA